MSKVVEVRCRGCGKYVRIDETRARQGTMTVFCSRACNIAFVERSAYENRIERLESKE